jgi:hypothetical protein
MKIRTNGDAIAHEFAKLMAGKPGLNKTASLNKKAEAEVSGGDTTVSLSSEVKDDAISDEDLVSLVSGPDDTKNDAVLNQIDESLDSISDADEAKDDSVKEHHKSARQSPSLIPPKGIKVMHGLGKIAASLRNKGENFAADVVEATALSISNDLKKEAAEKRSVISHLQKVARKLDSSGDKFAGDLVRTTMKNIIKK